MWTTEERARVTRRTSRLRICSSVKYCCTLHDDCSCVYVHRYYRKNNLRTSKNVISCKYDIWRVSFLHKLYYNGSSGKIPLSSQRPIFFLSSSIVEQERAWCWMKCENQSRKQEWCIWRGARRNERRENMSWIMLGWE